MILRPRSSAAASVRPADRHELLHAFLFALGSVAALWFCRGRGAAPQTDYTLLLCGCALLLVIWFVAGFSIIGRLLVPIIDLAAGVLVSASVLAFAASHELSAALRAVALTVLFLYIFSGLCLAVRGCEFSKLLSKRLTGEGSLRTRLRGYLALSAVFILVSFSLLLLLMRLAGDIT